MPTDKEVANPTPKKEFTEFVIKEVMIQKNVNREEALKILTTPEKKD